MKQGKVLRRIAMFVSAVALLASTVNTTYGYIVTSTSPLVNIFKPQDVQVSSLVVEKVVEHPLGTDYHIPDNIGFDFAIELGDYYANTRVITTTGEMATDANGTLNVTVKPGITFGVEELEAGTVVKITEQDTKYAGFSVKGEKTQTATVGTDGHIRISFTNIYQPESVTGEQITIKGTKVLEGREWKEGDTFTFKLEQQVGEQWKELGKETITYDAEKEDYNLFDFTEYVKNMKFDKVGTYQFRMTEVVGTLANVDYDKSVNYLHVKVTDIDMDGHLEIGEVTGTANAKVTKNEGTYEVDVTFNNKFVQPVIPDPEPVKIPINIYKTIENKGNIKLGAEGFEFVLENLETSESLATKSNTEGFASFELKFDKNSIDKTYRYKLYETNDGKKGMTYDSKVYEITISVKLDKDNKLVVTINGFDAKTFNAEFHNIYKKNQGTGPATGDVAELSYGFAMMLVSAATLIVLLITDREKKEETKE